jgi:hypothetical protein
MDFLRTSRRRTLLSEAVYIILNLAVIVAIFLTIYYVGSPFAAFGLVLLSKWRVFAVRPQYWFANIVANIVDVIVGLSFVVFLSNTNGELALQLIFAALYGVWLLFLKPQSKQKYVVVQAGTGLIVGSAALMQVSYDWYASFVVMALWIIGYTSARHALGAYNEPHTQILSLIWGLVVAEVGWMTYHWTLGYSFPFSDQLQIPQAAIFIGLLGFMSERVYASYHRHKEVRSHDVLLPIMFSISLMIACIAIEVIRRMQVV